MDRILGMSLVGAGPGNVFGPGMSAGALESFARDGRRAKAEGNSGRGAAVAGSGGGKCAARRTTGEAAEAKGAGFQEGRAAGADVTRSSPALDGRFGFHDVVAPY